MSFYNFAKAIVWLPWHLLFPTKVIGLEHFPKTGRAIGVCNHFAYKDPVQVGEYLPRRVRFLAKKQLFEHKGLGPLLRTLGGIPIDREHVGLSTLKEVLAVLKAEEFLMIFPEGTRNKSPDEALTTLKGGMAFFAVTGRAPIVPVMMYGRPRPFRKNYLLVGEPIPMDEYFGKKLTEQEYTAIDQMVFDRMKALYDLVPEKARKKYAAYLERRKKKAARLAAKAGKKEAP